ncbi:nucleotidyltransferase family protein [Sphingobium olei]|uniref:Nucleotidyltransferase family protein n=2 Tax=Sphingobium olei TaxID=420955 RepID=A0ABW3P0L5_9SPHN|nr:nucleotidyltransferase family protein [Sphingobium sp.]
MDQTAILQTLMMSDPLRRQALEAVAELDLPDCWIGAGFVRDALWAHLHGNDVTVPRGDVDVIWYNTAQPEESRDRSIEQSLRIKMPCLSWSVKNQARMHHRNGDDPYASVSDAMQHWPETATAVAVRLGRSGAVEVNAPFGLRDLFALRLQPTPNFLTTKHPIFMDRVNSKRWLERYPLLSLGDRHSGS